VTWEIFFTGVSEEQKLEESKGRDAFVYPSCCEFDVAADFHEEGLKIWQGRGER
jgi:hypothetical protein